MAENLTMRKRAPAPGDSQSALIQPSSPQAWRASMQLEAQSRMKRMSMSTGVPVVRLPPLEPVR